MLASGLLEEGYPEPLEEEDEIVQFEKLDPLPIRTPIRRDRDEILAQYLSSSPTAGQPQTWFTEQDINVAKQGGLVALANGGLIRRMTGGLGMSGTGGVAPGSSGSSSSGSSSSSGTAPSGTPSSSGNFGFMYGGDGGVTAVPTANTGLSSVAPTSIQGYMLANQPTPTVQRGDAFSPLAFLSAFLGDAASLAISPFGKFANQYGLLSSLAQSVLGDSAVTRGVQAVEGFSNPKGHVVPTISVAEGSPSLSAQTSPYGPFGQSTTPPPAQTVGIGEASTTTALPPPGLGSGLFSGGQVLSNGLKVIKGKSGLGAGPPGSMGGGGSSSTGGGYGSGTGAGGGGYGQPIEHPAVISQRRQLRRRKSQGPAAPVEDEIEARRFTVNPFNVENRLASIRGNRAPLQIPSISAQQVTLPTEASGALQGLLQRASALPIAQAPTQESINTSIEQQGTQALDDLFQRAAALPQAQEADLPQAQEAADGGTVGLATGGNTPVFEGRVMGTGDGMDDEIAFGVVPQTPADVPNTPDMALLSSDEYVMPADVVSMLGNGSSTAGSKMLDQFNQLLRRKAHGTNKQQTQLNAGKELSSLV